MSSGEKNSCGPCPYIAQSMVEKTHIIQCMNGNPAFVNMENRANESVLEGIFSHFFFLLI